MNRKSGFEYHKQFVTYLFTASNWEIDRWYHEHERMLQKAEEFGSESFKAMAMWIGSAVVFKYKYAAIQKILNSRGSFHAGWSNSLRLIYAQCTSAIHRDIMTNDARSAVRSVQRLSFRSARDPCTLRYMTKLAVEGISCTTNLIDRLKSGTRNHRYRHSLQVAI
jgi:hypothetical protein